MGRERGTREGPRFRSPKQVRVPDAQRLARGLDLHHQQRQGVPLVDEVHVEAVRAAALQGPVVPQVHTFRRDQVELGGAAEDGATDVLVPVLATDLCELTRAAGGRSEAH